MWRQHKNVIELIYSSRKLSRASRDHGGPGNLSSAKASKDNTEPSEGNMKLCNKHECQQQEAHRRSELAHYNEGVQLCVVDDHTNTGM